MLAGPILRRTTPDHAFIWIATSETCKASAHISHADESDTVGRGEGEMVKLGPRLFVHLIEAKPTRRGFPTDTFLSYDVALEREDGVSRLRDLGLLQGEGRITLGRAKLPTFFVSSNEVARNIMHGSCRQLHGGGEDAFLAADETLTQSSDDIDTRPSALFLTGDQIYADDVAAPLIAHVRALATELMGEGDVTSIPELDSLDKLGVNGRAEIIAERARFTSQKADNHLMSFGEWAAMYVTAWNPDVWPPSLPAAEQLIPDDEANKAGVTKERRKAASQRKALERALVALPSVRRVLANVPTYMIFDDHDVTDDWNITEEWCEGARRTAMGRRVISNALAAYWVFQGWGNHPDESDRELREQISSFFSGSLDGDEFDETMWSFDRWSYTAPFDPPTIILDTRTQRHYDSPKGGARLINETELERVAMLATDAGHEPGRPLMLISPVPVFGFEFQERRQKYLVGTLGPYEIDFEAWHSNMHGLVDFMRLLVEDLQPDPCIILSGDVHYGVNAQSSFAVDDKEIAVIQLVSSGFKHANLVAKSGLYLFGHLLRATHERLGWNKPPDHKAPDGAGQKLINRPPNTDEWADDSPVFLAPRHVKVLGIETPPDYRERRVYVRPSGRNRSVLIGENNVGLVTLEKEGVEHRVLSRGRRTHVHTARLRSVGTEDD
ncbi:MAG: hypothetical protein GEU68_00210 [Actinobacteria bacterium]|nr:hypothetical protein [Actinomycetota bacterium]